MKMEKKLIIVALILLSLFMIGAVSAASNTTEDIVNSDVSNDNEKVSHNVADKNTDTISEKKSVSTKDDKLSNKPDNDLLKDDEKTFNELRQNITDAGEGDTTITLQHDYVQDGYAEIVIDPNQKITIHGNGHTLDAKGKSRIFYVVGELILENLKIINGYSESTGGAIETCLDSNMTIINCTFLNNTAEIYGGAIDINEYNIVTITNSQFINNAVINGGNYGGAINIYSHSQVNLINNLFKKNYDYIGCAIVSSSSYSISGVNNVFIDNKPGVSTDIGAKTVPEGSFSELYAMLTTGTTGPKILTSDYTYNKTEGSSDYEFIGGIPINTTVHIIGNGHTISGNKTARIFTITNQATVTLKNLKLINGTITDSSGGAIHVNNATVNINNTTFNQNTAKYGGAIYAENHATVNITNTTFKQNTAYSGGAIYARNGATVNINNTTFKQNTATYDGGAIDAYNGATVNINNTTFKQNTANSGDGGAIYATSSATVNINNTQFNQNTATGTYSDGGAIYATSSATVNIINTQFSGNKAKSFGGAIYASGVHVIVVQSSIVGSTADSGSAIRAVDSSYITINNTCISNNIAKSDRTISVEDSYVNITRSSITNNTAGYGGAIYTARSEINIIYTSFIKNTANSSENGGGAIYIDENSKTNITNSLFTDNKANTTGAAIYARKFDNIKITNNIFLNNTNTENSIIYLDKQDPGFAFKYNLDYNWFANNATNYNIKPDVTINNSGVLEELSNWLFLNATSNPDPIDILSTSNITFKLSLYNSTNNNVSEYDNKQLYPVNLTLEYRNGTGNNNVPLGDKITFTPQKLGTASVTASISTTAYTIPLTIKYYTEFTIDNIPDITEGDSINLTVSEKNNYTGSVIVSIGSENYTVTLTNGLGKTTVTPKLKPGTYNATILFKGDETYNATKATSNTFNIKYPTNLTITVSNSTTDKPINIILHEDNRLTGEVIFVLDGKTYYLTLQDGEGTRNNITINKTGAYTVDLTYPGDETYAPASTSTKFYIKYPTQFTITTSNSTTDKPITITVHEDNNFTGTIKVNINGIDYEVTLTDGEGTNNTIIINKTGQYNATIDYPGDETYNATKATSNTFNIKYPTEFTIDNIPDITEEDSITLTVTEKNNYTGPVNVTIGSENYTVTLINGSGKTTITPKLKPGTYNATITFKGDKTYNATKATSNNFKINNKPAPTPNPSNPTVNPTKKAYKVKIYLTLKKVKKVSKKTKKLYLKVIVKRNGKKLLTKKITIKVKRNKVKAKKTNKNKAKTKKLSKVQGFKFTVKINGKTYTKKTNKKGKITYTINNLYNKGTYKSKISYKSKYYYKNGKNIKFKIKA